MCIKINKVSKQEVGIKYDIWSQASYRYPISLEAFFDPSDSYFLFAEERGYHKLTVHLVFFYMYVPLFFRFIFHIFVIPPLFGKQEVGI
jgi:hypothetical protein